MQLAQEKPQFWQGQDSKSQNCRFIVIFSIIIVILALLVILVTLLISHTQLHPHNDQPLVLSSPNSVTITIAATNDIHGTYYSRLFVRKDNRQKYQYGGLQVMAKIIQILKQQNPQHFIYLDAGDQFQGGFQSSKQISSGQIMTDYFNHLRLKASAPGNHEFDFGQQFLTNYLSKLQNKVLSSNLIDKKYTQSSSKYLPLHNQQASRLYSFPIPKSVTAKTNLTQIKIGVIGLTTVQTQYTTSGFTQHLFPRTYEFLEYKWVVFRQAEKLKKRGANAIIILSHVGNECGRDTTFGIWTVQNQGNIGNCRKDDQIFNLIDSVPQGTIHAVIQGHRHSTSHYFYKNIPIMGNINGGYYLSALYLKFNIQEDNISINSQQTRIQGPIPVCQQLFKNTKKCQFIPKEQLKDAGELIDAYFHGKKIQKDEHLAEIVQKKWGQLMMKYQIQIVQNQIPFPLEKTYATYNPLGNLVTNLIASNLESRQLEFDFVIINSGGFRSAWYPGILKYAELHSMFPFGGTISFVDITGANLRNSMLILQNGKKAFYPTWGLSQTFKQIDKQNELLQLIDLTHSNGSPILDKQVYVFASLNFLVEGGDDFKDVKQYFQSVRNTDIVLKDAIQQQLQKLGQLTQGNLYNSSNKQRLVILE